MIIMQYMARDPDNNVDNPEHTEPPLKSYSPKELGLGSFSFERRRH